MALMADRVLQHDTYCATAFKTFGGSGEKTPPEKEVVFPFQVPLGILPPAFSGKSHSKGHDLVFLILLSCPAGGPKSLVSTSGCQRR